MEQPGPRAAAWSESEPSCSSASAGGLFSRIDQFDRRLSLRVCGLLAAVPRSALQWLEYSGDGLLSIPLTGALWLAPVLLDQRDFRAFLFNLLVAFLLDLVLVGAIKSAVRRPRPAYNTGMYLVLSVDVHSLPSGHSSRVLMIATFFWLHLPMWCTFLAPWTRGSWTGVGSGYVPPLEMCLLAAVWAWALATASSRVLLGRHYVLDVLLGCLTGILEALFAHGVLAVPSDVSEGLHDWVLRVFTRA